MKELLLLISFVLLTGCHTGYDGEYPYYSGSGTLKELIKARYECMQEQSAQDHGEFNRGHYSCARLNSCVVGKGFFRDPEGSIYLPDAYSVACSESGPIRDRG
jgi:hypothetical protein